jgi:hypothetical protein
MSKEEIDRWLEIYRDGLNLIIFDTATDQDRFFHSATNIFSQAVFDVTSGLCHRLSLLSL